MSERYEFFEHTADIGVHVHGASLSELFTNAAAGMFAAMGELQKSDGKCQKTIELQTDTPEDLLRDWLAELLFEVSASQTMYDLFDFEQLDTCRLKASLSGGVIDFSKSKAREEIKAVTYHQLCVEQLPDTSWRATVIFDV